MAAHGIRGHGHRVVSALIVITLNLLSQRLLADTPDLARAAARVTQIIAHRGACVERPESTLSAFQRAIEVGATAVEVDVRVSSDGQFFLLHDATLDRTTNAQGLASKRTLRELQELDAGFKFGAAYQGERIPSLIEAAEICRGKVDLLLDLKEQGADFDRQVVDVIRKHGDPSRTIAGVRTISQAKRFRKLLPEARQLAMIPTVDMIEEFAAAGVDTIRLWPKWLKENDAPVQRVRAAGKKLHLNGSSGNLEETLALLVYEPDSLLSDDPRRQKATLTRIASGDLPDKLLRP